MTVVGDTRVLPEALVASAKRLRPIFERLGTRGAKDTKEMTVTSLGFSFVSFVSFVVKSSLE